MARNEMSFEATKAWFNLSNYAGLKTFTHAQWGEQIARRYFIQDALNLGNNPRLLDKEVPRLTTEPLAPWHFGYGTDFVRDLRIRDLDRLVNVRENQPDMTFPPEALASKLHETLSDFGHLIIDLNARDQTLKAKFSSWLVEQRRAMAPDFTPPKGIGSRTFINWQKKGLLPYFDLVAWAKWSGNHLTDSHLIDLLPQDKNGGDLRKVKRNVKSVISLPNAVSLMR